MKNTPVRGQEAVVPVHGLGRIHDWNLPPWEGPGDAPNSWIEVQTHDDGIRRRYAPHNVRYVEIQYSRH